ncbi:M15 family metallopeptidase [Nocardioides sp. CFH 31398]|uniref:M15 family metallopeptidase n=1 Tax=Nocardioides sp. CFH 31398 TaxID=2919579 RepID=UPI001F0685BB|nr:M15 family metallopeptidase [Nocardioides sp. CFH 31398]MCH1867126.1 M15 family metallopeptidase [Nocardioides sp. CFH 31398]
MTTRLGSPLAALVAVLLTAGLLAAPASTASPRDGRAADGGTSLAVPRGYADTVVTATVRVVDGDGEPVADEPVRLQRYDGRDWQPVADLTTGADGDAQHDVTLRRTPERNRFRALRTTADGTESDRRDVAVLRRNTVLRGFAQQKVRDGRPVTLRVSWVTGNDEPVAGAVRVERGTRDGWTTATRLRTDADGKARWTTTPRSDVRYRLVGAASSWHVGDTSPVLRIDNLPPGTPVSLPAGAPRPRRGLPDQARAVGKGANASAVRIPDPVWRSMVGRSWRRGCPVGRPGLRLVRTNYWDFDGYRRRGELVVNAAIVGKTLGVVRALYAAEIPVRHMYRVDRFGYSDRLNGADDYASMAADNTSAFNCRDVVGAPGRRSPHSYGRSIDINPWENPYRSNNGWTPNTWWVGRSHPRVAWRSAEHQVVRIFAAHGFRWTYGTFDAHHFDGRPVARLGRRPLACDGGVCH